jgi:hypothetical protein
MRDRTTSGLRAERLKKGEERAAKVRRLLPRRERAGWLNIAEQEPPMMTTPPTAEGKEYRRAMPKQLAGRTGL